MAYQKYLRVVKIQNKKKTLFLLILPQKRFVAHRNYSPHHGEENILTKMKIKLNN